MSDDTPADIREQDDNTVETSKTVETILVPYGTWYDTVVGPFIND